MGDAAALEGLRAANAAFYAAFESLKLEQMDAVWLRTDEARCVHPGWRKLDGWAAVRKSWEQIFEHAEAMQFLVRDVDAWVEGDCGWVTCQENLVQVAGADEVLGTMYATNIFRHVRGGWRMVLHHASPVAPGV